jgi:hypothetical protein
MASVLVMQSLIENDRFMRECGFDPDKRRPAQAEKMNDAKERLAKEYGAICCFLGDEKMDAILAASPPARATPDTEASK